VPPNCAAYHTTEIPAPSLGRDMARSDVQPPDSPKIWLAYICTTWGSFFQTSSLHHQAHHVNLDVLFHRHCFYHPFTLISDFAIGWTSKVLLPIMLVAVTIYASHALRSEARTRTASLSDGSGPNRLKIPGFFYRTALPDKI
jgi:hypothetical protein